MNSESRIEKEIPIRFQHRDLDILHSIYENGGVMAKRQLKEKFWQDKTFRAMEKRLSKLYHNGYLNWPERDQWRSHPVPEAVCWLGWKGALILSSAYGISIDIPTATNENQHRKMERQLRKYDFRWLREPRWIQLEHDLAIVDFRLLLEKSLEERRNLSLAEWLDEGVFRSQMDVVEFEVKSKNGSIRKTKRGVIPDAYFVVDDEQRRKNGQPHRARFLLELDRATHANPSFGFEKALPGAAYIGSPAYKERFGQNSGSWLIVTTAGRRRMENLIHQTANKVGSKADLFYFSTLNQCSGENLITSKLWYQVCSSEPMALIK